MRPLAPHRSLIALLRGSTRLAALVLTLFLAGMVTDVACADHDLADAGIGEHRGDMPAPDDSNGGGGGSSAHPDGHCCHSGGCHAPAIPSIVDTRPIEATTVEDCAIESNRRSALVQRDLRPPIF
jgi:hypothetical protein